MCNLNVRRLTQDLQTCKQRLTIKRANFVRDSDGTARHWSGRHVLSAQRRELCIHFLPDTACPRIESRFLIGFAALHSDQLEDCLQRMCFVGLARRPMLFHDQSSLVEMFRPDLSWPTSRASRRRVL